MKITLRKVIRDKYTTLIEKEKIFDLKIEQIEFYNDEIVKIKAYCNENLDFTVDFTTEEINSIIDFVNKRR